MNWFLWALMAAGIWGFVPLLEKYGLAKTEPMVGIFFRCLGIVFGFLMMTLFFIRPHHIKSVDIRSALCLIAGGFLASFVAQIAFYNSLKLGEMSRVVPISASYPLIVFLLGVIVLHESFTLPKFLGGILIVLGIWLLKIG